MEISWRLFTYCALYVLNSLTFASAEFCQAYGHSCNAPYRCCAEACCIPQDLEDHYRHHLRWSVWNMWYFWFVVLFVLMSCFGACSYYRRHQLLIARHQALMTGNSGPPTRPQAEWRLTPSFPVSLFSGFSSRNTHQASESLTQVEPHVPRQVFPSPPAYSDVVSNPDEYPRRKDPELPPYPGMGHQELLSGGLPPYSATVVQLPPYCPSERPAVHSETQTSPTSPCEPRRENIDQCASPPSGMTQAANQAHSGTTS